MQNYTPYQSYQFNQMLSPQQRLMQLEAQYPQFVQQPAGQNARSYVVLNKEEANAQQVPTDGSTTVFINKADNEIYTKGLDNTGLLAFKTYKMVQDVKKPEQNTSPDFEELKKDIKEIKETIKEFKNVKQSDTDISINRTIKKQPKPSDDDTANVRQ